MNEELRPSSSSTTSWYADGVFHVNEWRIWYGVSARVWLVTEPGILGSGPSYANYFRRRRHRA